MRNLEAIENDLALARKEAENITGTQAEVYSRIVGYYRSVRNWNKGKREEYGERKLFDVSGSCDENGCALDTSALSKANTAALEHAAYAPTTTANTTGTRLKLFVRPHCPACPSAKDAAGKLGIPIDTVDADTEAGLEEAQRMNVFSTPTAILFAQDGSELRRARDANAIASLLGNHTKQVLEAVA
jgi:ribonucleoside-triphosphate reductase